MVPGCLLSNFYKQPIFSISHTFLILSTYIIEGAPSGAVQIPLKNNNIIKTKCKGHSKDKSYVLSRDDNLGRVIWGDCNLGRVHAWHV